MKPVPQLIATDVILFSQSENGTSVLLIQRKNEPYINSWALPGGFVDADEDVKDGAIRELKEETSLHIENLKLTGVYGNPGRDPRGRVISCAYATIIIAREFNPVAADDAKNVRWFSLSELPILAFDHAIIIAEAAQKMLK